MAKLQTAIPAPQFELQNTLDQTVKLAEYTARGAVVLVLTRGFV